eukprot:1054747-Pleurochrysis_carterae.AAC.1
MHRYLCVPECPPCTLHLHRCDTFRELIMTSSSAGDRPWYGLARRPSPKKVGEVPGLEAIGNHPPTGSQRPGSVRSSG